MVRFLALRAATALATVLAAVALIVALSFAVPGDLATALLGPQATPELVARFNTDLGLDRGFVGRLWLFLSGLLHGDLGTDPVSRRPIALVVAEALPSTAALAFAAVALAMGLGVPLGAYAATHQDEPLERVLGLISVGLIAVPSFVIAVLLVLVFSIHFRALPVLGTGGGGLGDTLARLVLPSVALAASWVGYIARLVRSSLLDVLDEPYVRTYRAFGVPERRIVLRLALRNACLPTVSVLGLALGTLLGGALIVEVVFARPGLGTLMFNAISLRNFPLVQAAAIATVLLYALANLLADLAIAWLDPRIRDRMAQAAIAPRAPA